MVYAISMCYIYWWHTVGVLVLCAGPDIYTVASNLMNDLDLVAGFIWFRLSLLYVNTNKWWDKSINHINKSKIGYIINGDQKKKTSGFWKSKKFQTEEWELCLMNENLNAGAYNYISDNSLLSIVERGKSFSVSIQYFLHKARPIKKCFFQFDVEELASTEPWPQPLSTPLG